ncbi:hypothetical protein CFBP3846_P100033 (plasmid) [Pseudomonas syringae pv. avii]|uniref:Uncharacterized protein n=3 Tax=Pseudomonas TaxID=286 RepID=A0ABY1UFM2_PSESX|nr:hypothetical protein PCPL58_p1093 [Pseudomonas cerasi]SOS30475.1 hypothetical protein PL963_P500021 [Pseudomonas cerasi]SOS30566.1 hypothetical protein CFBP3846_P100033 [Pseudomonas syringae pv. avii]SPD89666.1 hypothetical protein PSCFBP3800_P200030 [Pseudomonas syringae group genomosp. 3]
MSEVLTVRFFPNSAGSPSLRVSAMEPISPRIFHTSGLLPFAQPNSEFLNINSNEQMNFPY